VPKSRHAVSIDEFLKVTEKRLRGHLSEARVQEVLSEVSSHFGDHAEDLHAEGLPLSQAEATAVAMFGGPKEWAKSVVNSTYADGFTRNAALIAICSAGVFLLAVAIAPLLADLSFAFMLMLTIGLAYGAYRARRWQTPRILALGLAAGVLSFVVSGAVRLPLIPGVVALSPSTLSTITKVFDFIGGIQSQNRSLLNAGWKTYLVGNGPAIVPAELRSGVGYIVPLTPDNDPDDVDDVFKDTGQTVQNKVFPEFMEANPYRTVATKGEARAIWRAEAPAWRKIETKNIDMTTATPQIRKVCKRKGSFDIRAALPGLWIILLNLPFLLLLDLVAAAMGRAAHRKAQRRRLSTV